MDALNRNIRGVNAKGPITVLAIPPLPEPVEGRSILTELQLLPLELKLLLFGGAIRRSPCWGEIKDEIRTFKYPVGCIDVNVGHPHQMSLLWGEEGYRISFFLRRNNIESQWGFVLGIASVSRGIEIIPLFLFHSLPAARRQ